jgi:putative CocE/NonD family hydrolase
MVVTGMFAPTPAPYITMVMGQQWSGRAFSSGGRPAHRAPTRLILRAGTRRRMRIAVLLVASLSVVAALAGCATKTDTPSTSAPVGSNGLVAVQDRHLEAFRTQQDPACVATKDAPCEPSFYSHTLAPGPYAVEAARQVFVPVTLPATDGGSGLTGDARMSLGLFLPAIPGCDWAAASLPDKCKVPVVGDAGPYYGSSTGNAVLNGQDCPEPVASVVGSCVVGEGDTPVTERAHRLGGFLIENLVPYGYAVAQISVFGTGDSTHCQDLMGPAEQLGLDAAVTWLGTQPWSNGKVALTGRSYDGSTPWEAATFGNPHLATIVPISGLTSVFDLMYHNGTSETRGAGELYALYAAMTVDGEAADATQVVCPEYLVGAPEGVKAVLGGDPDPADPYWSDRVFLDRALEHFKGPIFLIHGLQDWNVDPHMAFPAYNEFEAKGNPVKALLGQWYHNYPDRPSEHALQGSGRGKEAFPYSVRYDWAQDMLEWFNWTLKGGAKPDLHVEVQDNQGFWRVEGTWPPAGRTPFHAAITAAGETAGDGTAITATNTLHFDLGPLDTENDARISGQPHLDQWVTPAGPGGQVYAMLVDRDNGNLHLGHAIMDLRYNGGGRSPGAVVPGVAMKARLEFEPMEALLPKGHHLGLELSATGEDYVGPTVAQPVVLDLGEARSGDNGVDLGLAYPKASQFFTPPVWSGVATAGPPQP